MSNVRRTSSLVVYRTGLAAYARQARRELEFLLRGVQESSFTPDKLLTEPLTSALLDVEALTEQLREIMDGDGDAGEERLGEEGRETTVDRPGDAHRAGDH